MQSQVATLPLWNPDATTPERSDTLVTNFSSMDVGTIDSRHLPTTLVSFLNPLLKQMDYSSIDVNGQTNYLNVSFYVARPKPGRDRGYQVQIKDKGTKFWFGPYNDTMVAAVVACAWRFDKNNIVDNPLHSQLQASYR